MFNEEVKERIEQHRKEAETYALHQRLGYSDSSIARWVFVLIVILIAAAAVGVFL